MITAAKRAADIEYAQLWGFEHANAWTTRDEECAGGTDAILAFSLFAPAAICSLFSFADLELFCFGNLC